MSCHRQYPVLGIADGKGSSGCHHSHRRDKDRDRDRDRGKGSSKNGGNKLKKKSKDNKRTEESQDSQAAQPPVDNDPWHQPVWSAIDGYVVNQNGEVAGLLHHDGHRVWNITGTNIIGRYHAGYMTLTRIPIDAPSTYPYPENQEQAELMNATGKHNYF